MTHEKIFVLETGRSVKVIISNALIQIDSKLELEIDVLIKEPKELEFRPPIGATHPQYWKLKKLDLQHSRVLQMEYSGLSEKHIKIAVKEMKALMDKLIVDMP